MQGTCHGLVDASTPCAAHGGWEPWGLRCTLACCPSGQSASPHTVGSWPWVPASRSGEADRQGPWGGSDCRGPSRFAGSTAGRGGPGPLPSLPFSTPSRSFQSPGVCIGGAGGVMVLDLCEICSGAPSSGLSRGRHSTNTPCLQPLVTRMTARARARTGSSQEGQGSRPYESWAETREAFLPFTPPPRSPGAGWGPAQPCQLPARGGPRLRAKALQGGSVWLSGACSGRWEGGLGPWAWTKWAVAAGRVQRACPVIGRLQGPNPAACQPHGTRAARRTHFLRKVRSPSEQTLLLHPER